MSLPADLNRILEEDDWLRRIARRLADDSASSEDLAQDAWVAALTRKRADRPWLFGVMRNLRRESARRTHRDENLRDDLPRPGESPAADEVVAELVLRKRVTAGLLELEEPYRTAIYLRYVQDESLPVIARRTGVAVSTAHGRITRGLELLRVQLDDHYDGERKTWALGLLSLAEPTGTAASLISGGILLGASAKIIAALLVVSGGVALLWNSDSEAAEPFEQVVPETTAKRVEAPVELAAMPSLDSERAPVSVKPAETTKTPDDTTGARLTWSGRVIDLDGAPVAGVVVSLKNHPDENEDEESAVTTDGAGAFTYTSSADIGDDPRFVVAGNEWVTVLAGVRSGLEHVVVVGKPVLFAGVVVDESGEPVADADVRFNFRQSLFRELSIPRPFRALQFERSTHTDELGAFEISDICGGSHIGLWISAPSFALESVELPSQGDSAMRIVLRAPSHEQLLTGFVLDNLGEPVEGASVSAGTEIVRSDEDGAFELAWQDGSADFKTSDGSWGAQFQNDSSVLRAAYPGIMPAEQPIKELDLTREIILRLGPSTLSVSGRVVDELGRPRADVIVWIDDLTPFGTQSEETGASRAVWNVSVEELNSSNDRGVGTQTDSEGRFELDGMLAREYQLRAFHVTTATQGGPWPIMAGTSETVFVLEAEPETTRVAGRVVSGSGVPLADVWIIPRRSQVFDADTRPPHIPQVRIGQRTNEAGEFDFPSLATQGTVLELQHELFFIRQFALEGVDQLDELEIVEAVLCDLQIELAWDVDLADKVRVLDRGGEPVEILESYGAFLATGDSARIINGKSSVFRVSEDAHTLVLLKDDVEVLRESVVVTPTELTSIKL